MIGLLLAVGLSAHPVLDVVSLVAVETTLAIDMHQTFKIKNHPGMMEMNPVLGQHPSDLKIALYTGGWMVASAVACLVLPPPWRWMAMLAITSVELMAIQNNYHNGLGF
jgi:hypothetical protein